ncbi:hypothetical protein GQ457_04G020320 [Hibiscus cannabinus]
MPMRCSLCLRPTLVLAAVFVSGVSFMVGPFQWSFFRLEFVANLTDWSMEQPFSVALAAAEGTPLSHDLCFGHLWCVRPLYAGCFLGLHPALWLLDDWERGIALTARPHWWQCFGTAAAALSTRMPLVILLSPRKNKMQLLLLLAIPTEDFACSLVGKVVSPPTVDGGRLIRQFRSIWKDDKILTISEINPNFFLISFASPENRANVLKRGPWDFQKYWFALEQADPNQTIHDYSFLHMCIWVRIHNIPLSLMTAALARVLGASIGKVIMTDSRLEDGNMGEFMRVRVLIDTSKPLRRCVVLSRPDAKASMCPLQYERLPLFCHGCGLIGHLVLACPITLKVEGQKFQYGAWLRAPLPKRSATRPRGRLSIVDDDLHVPVSVDSATEGPSTRPHGTTASTSAPDPAVSIVAVPAVRMPPPAADNTPDLSAPLEKDDLVEDGLDEAPPEQDASELAADRSIPDDTPYDPMVHNETSDMLEEALEISRDCVLLADLTGVIQADGEDLVIEAIPEAADSIIWEVVASILGVPAPPDAPVVPSLQGPPLSASLSKPGLSKSAPAGLRRSAMPVVPEHQEFDEWCAAWSRTPPANVHNQPAEARTSSIPPPRPHKGQASSSDPSRA